MMRTALDFWHRFSAWLPKKLRRSPQTPKFNALVEQFGDALSQGDYTSARSFMSEIMTCPVPDTFEPSDADNLYSEATQAEMSGDWPEAERLYREAIALEENDGNPTRGYRRIARLFCFLGRNREAREACLKAYDLAQSEPASDVMQAMSARQLARLPTTDADLAENERILRSAYELIASDDKLLALECSGLLAELANTRLLREDVADAHTLIEQSFAVIEPHRELHDLPGYQISLTRAWQLRAQILHRSGENALAIDAWKRALECDRQVAEFDEDCSAIDGDRQSRLRYAAAECISAAGDAKLATSIRQECDELRMQWGLPPL